MFPGDKERKGNPLAELGRLMSTLHGGGDKGATFPKSDVDDLENGALFIPYGVTDARRAGDTVSFVQNCTNHCCWYWKMPDGSRIYHFDQGQYETLAKQHGGVCPECGNRNITGSTIPASEVNDKEEIMTEERRRQPRAPRNTSEETRRNPGAFLTQASAMGGSRAIEAQEAEGQQSFVKSTTLPTKYGYGEYNVRTVLEAAGVKFGELVQGDPLFQYVELPEGWQKVATDHSMHSKLLDDKGRERASIFYKAAFYDRSANISLTRRFGYRRDYDRQESEGVAVAVVMDGNTVVHTTEPIQLPSERGDEYSKVATVVEQTAKTWLDDHYPDWQNPGAYWG